VAIFVFIPSGVISSEPTGLLRFFNSLQKKRAIKFHVRQIIHWNFERRFDTTEVEVEWNDSSLVHLTLPRERMEFYLVERQLYTVNHDTKQILEDSLVASPLRLLFADLEPDSLKLVARKSGSNPMEEYVWDSALGRWERLWVKWSAPDWPDEIELVDFDGNQYTITFSPFEKMRPFSLQKLENNTWGYERVPLSKRVGEP